MSNRIANENIYDIVLEGIKHFKDTGLDEVSLGDLFQYLRSKYWDMDEMDFRNGISRGFAIKDMYLTFNRKLKLKDTPKWIIIED